MPPAPPGSLAARVAVVRRRARDLLLGPTLRWVSRAMARLPWRVVQRLGAGFGTLAWPLLGRDRRRILEHLSIAFPEWSESERRRVGRACLRHLGTTAFELLHALERPTDDLLEHLEFEGQEVFDRLRAEDRKILLLANHCGNWELISLANKAFGAGFVAMARELDDAAANQFAVGLREAFGTEVIERGSRSSSRQILRALRTGKVLAMLVDQDIQTDGVWVPFFGRLAHTPSALADLALRLDAAVVPAFDERLADGSHRIRFLEPLDLPDDPTAATAAMTEVIEQQIRRRPEQWVWMHRRWRRQPPA